MDAVMEQEMLAAFVDGALSPEESAAVVLHLADHPGDAAYVDALMELNALLGQAFAEPLHRPAPAGIVAAIGGEAAAAAAVGAPAPRRAARAGWRRLAPRRPRLGIAAAVAAAAALVALALGPMPFGPRPVQILGAPPSVDANLRAALETLPSGPVSTPGAEQITLVGTFLDGTNRPCREYELIDPAANAMTQGVACRSAAGEWSTEVSVASRLDPAAARDAFVPAAGAKGDPEALDRALDRLGAGMTMTADEEHALISGWKG